MKYMIFLFMMVFMAACSQSAEPELLQPTTDLAPVEETTVIEPTMAADNTAVPAAPSEEPPAPTEPAAVEAPTVEAAAEETAVPEIEPIEVTYITPAQQEGPYYIVNKPEDRDNDLVDFAGASGPPRGQILEFGGEVYDVNGLPVQGLTIEIWQTDESGVYDHPNDPGTASRDPNFQYYGEATTDAAGSYSFRTIVPGQYEPRPPHIHFKVKLGDQELLTSQFYFSDVADLQGAEEALLIAAVPGQDAGGNSILIAERDIILNLALANQ